MDVAWVPGIDPDSSLAKQLYKDRVAPPSLDTTVVDVPALTWLKELILHVKNSTTIAKPIGDLHLISHGDDSGWLRLDLDGMSNNAVTYQVLREILDASSPTRRDGLSLRISSGNCASIARLRRTSASYSESAISGSSSP